MTLKIINPLNPSENHDLPGNEIYEGTASAANKLLKRSEVQAEFPENNPTQLGLINNTATVVEPFIPTSGTTLTFDAPRRYGSLTSPRTTITINLADARQTDCIFYLDTATIPARIDPDRNIDILPWLGDAFDGAANKVNRLQISLSIESEPLSRSIQITNKVYDTSELVNDISLAGWWRFDDPTNDVCIDKSGNYNDGTNADPGTITRVAGQVGNCAQTNSNSTTARFQVPHSASLVATDQMTFMCWINLDAAEFASSIGIASKNANVANSGWVISRNATAGRIRFRINGTPGYQIDSAAMVYNTGGAWMHIAFTYNNGTLRGYINGVFAAQDVNADADIVDTGQPLWLCGNAASEAGVANSGLRTNGKMDNAKYWTKALSDSEILAEYEKDI